MKELKTFYVAYPKDKFLKNCLNSLKILANMQQRTEAHITIRGPYKRRLAKNYIEEYSNIISNVKLNIFKVDNFFQYNQNTVFYRCDDNELLRKVWKKFSYNNFNPHITIYDGRDSEWAKKIYDVLRQDFQPFECMIDELTYLEPKRNDSLPFEYLKTKFDYDFFKEYFENDVLAQHCLDFNYLNCNYKERLKCIKKIAGCIYSDEKKYNKTDKILCTEKVEIKSKNFLACSRI